MKFCGETSAKGIILRYTSKPERGLCILQPSEYFSRRMHRSCIFCGFFRVSRYGIVKLSTIWNAKRDESVEKQNLSCIIEYIGFTIKYMLYCVIYG